MKKLHLVLMTAASLLFVNCMNHDDDMNVNIPLDKNAVSENAKELFGEIDPSQDWSSITQGSIIVTADADLKDIEKVQILTESPFSNSNAFVLNEANVSKGQKVKLVYDAPNVYDTLFAACISKDKTYYVKVFSVNDSEVSFTEPAASRMNRAGEQNQYPNLSDIVLGAPEKSINALRAEASAADPKKPYVIIYDKGDKDNGGSNRINESWADGSWANDQLWAATDGSSNGWTIANGEIKKTVSEKTDLNTLKWIVNYYLPKTGAEYTTGTGNKSNNWKSIVEGTNYFKQYKNHFYTDGNPLTIIPLQMNTTEGKYNTVYYYYFPASKLDEFKTKEDPDEAMAAYIKTLPKFKAIKGYQDANFTRKTQYLLPYYGDGAVTEGTVAENLSIPANYLVGFMNQKIYSEPDQKHEAIEQCMNGDTYGFGPLNKATNTIFGHYFSSMSTDVTMQSTKIKSDGSKETQTQNGSTPYGMTWDSPRIGILSANNKVFMCFEDGCDCNFSDMIIEISSGVEVTNDPVEPEAVAYTMCFEDEPEVADYDMNDVVLRAVRKNESDIQISLIACGANDELLLQGYKDNNLLNGTKEVHKFFGVTPGDKFVNTVVGENYFTPKTITLKIDNSVNIADFLKSISLKNVKTGQTISMPKNGEPPYAIIVPLNFRYPVERCSIISAYPDFVKWAQNRNEATDWYLNGVENRLYPDMFSTAE
ncbi:DUF4842 domain-containing protein [uncultured Prevotella sp.]|uniref:DUF4842 domain-containing protein n=1 Tax=uncultured Prevotella sp. TaxID=159272 RepID=UPI00258744DA|nr:DUF4842 domain-containing protein [uncultured Prevotella sp.]